MIKVLLTATLVSLLAMTSEPKVYICNSENTVAYHLTKDCRGIKQCKKEILEVTKQEAKKLYGWSLSEL